MDYDADLAAIYRELAERQQRLGSEFEAAIFDNVEGLYTP